MMHYQFLIDNEFLFLKIFGFSTENYKKRRGSMSRKKGQWNWMIIVALVIASVLVYSFNAALAAPPHPPRYGSPPGHPPGPHPGPPLSGRRRLLLGLQPPGRPWDHPRREKSGSVLKEAGWPCRIPPGKALISGMERSGSLIPLLRLKAQNGSPGIGPPTAGSPGIGLPTRLRDREHIGSQDIGAQRVIGNPATGNNNHSPWPERVRGFSFQGPVLGRDFCTAIHRQRTRFERISTVP